MPKTTSAKPWPLADAMFVEVEIRGQPRDGVIVIPRVATHRGPNGDPVVYLAGADDRLAFRPREPGPTQDDLMVVQSGLEAGDRVIVTDLIPAIEGMLLSATVDTALADRLLAEAAADVPVR